MSDNEFSSRHRLFHAMVLMGGGLALRCGGQAATNSEGVGAAGAGGTSTAVGGSATATGGSATGGITIISIPPTTGGTTSMPASGGRPSVDPPDCPPAQWNCASDAPTCYGSGFSLPENCVCDANRPLSASACGPGESLVCYEARYDIRGQSLPEPVQFDCSCLKNQLHCGLACDAIFPNTGNCSQKDYADSGLREILCGCAVIVLR